MSTLDPSEAGEKGTLRGVVTAAIYEAEGWGNDLPAADPNHWPSKSAYRVADAVLDALADRLRSCQACGEEWDHEDYDRCVCGWVRPPRSGSTPEKGGST